MQSCSRSVNFMVLAAFQASFDLHFGVRIGLAPYCKKNSYAKKTLRAQDVSMLAGSLWLRKKDRLPGQP
jgi:hypothetical protein